MSLFDNGRQVLNHLESYYNESIGKEKKVIRQESIKTLHEEMDLASHIQSGDLTGERLDEFLKIYLDNTTRLHHPGYLAHQVGIPHITGALGSLIDGFTNNAMSIYEMGPAAAAIEFFMVNLLLEKIGWTPMPTEIETRLTYPHGAGILTHGGSLANMTALLAARNHLDSTIRETGVASDLIILAPESSHYSVAKAAGIIGIGEKNLWPLATDIHGRVRVPELERVFQTAKAENRRIVALVANACATGTGLYDPIGEIGDFCNEKGIWFHVDGAHGGAALFSDTRKNLLTGIHKADSMIIDAHKMLRTPTVCAALLVKHASALDHTFQSKADYLFHEKKNPGFDFLGQGMECTKAGLGLRFFMTLAAIGEKNMGGYIDAVYDLAAEAYDFIMAQPDFEVPVKPESNILCFRLKASDGVQIRIRDRLIEEGSFYLSSTELNGLRYLRMVIMNPETKLHHIKELISAIRKIAEPMK